MKKSVKRMIIAGSGLALGAITTSVVVPLVTSINQQHSDKQKNILYRNVQYKQVDNVLIKNIKNLKFDLNSKELEFNLLDKNNKYFQSTNLSHDSEYKISLKYSKEKDKFLFRQINSESNEVLNEFYVDISWDQNKQEYIIKHNNIVYYQNDVLRQINRENNFAFIFPLFWAIGVIFGGLAVASQPEIVTKPFETITNAISSATNSHSGGTTYSPSAPSTSTQSERDYLKIGRWIGGFVGATSLTKALDSVKREKSKENKNEYYLVTVYPKVPATKESPEKEERVRIFSEPVSKYIAEKIIVFSSESTEELKENDKWLWNKEITKDNEFYKISPEFKNLVYIDVYTEEQLKAGQLAKEAAAELNRIEPGSQWVGEYNIKENIKLNHYKHYHVKESKVNRTKIKKKNTHIFFGKNRVV